MNRYYNATQLLLTRFNENVEKSKPEDELEVDLLHNWILCMLDWEIFSSIPIFKHINLSIDIVSTTYNGFYLEFGNISTYRARYIKNFKDFAEIINKVSDLLNKYSDNKITSYYFLPEIEPFGEWHIIINH